MRLGIITARIGFNNGQGRVNYEIAAEALRQGHEVVLFCESADEKMLGQTAVRPELMPAPSWLPTRMLKDQLFAFRTHQRLCILPVGRAALREQRCDALLANGFVTWARADINAVHFVHSSWRRSPHHPWHKHHSAYSMYMKTYNNINSVLERGAFRRSQTIVAVSDKVRLELIELGISSSSIETILNGVDSDEFSPGSPQRDRFNLPKSAVIALFAGDLKDSRKNLDTVLAALARVPGLHLAVAGSHEGTSWPRLAANLNLSERVHFLGFQQDMPALMRSVDLLVFPSRYEACSLVLLEALASGLPVVTARSSGGAELITSQVGVVIEDSEDVLSLVQELESLVASSDRRQKMASAARKKALLHSWPAMAERYVRLLENAAKCSRV